MFNFFEQPWTLLVISFLVLYALFRFRSIFPRKRRWWQWLIPPFIAAAAFALEFFVQSDREKINAVIESGIKAVEQENCYAIHAIIAPDYQDSHHITKDDLMIHCQKELSRPVVEQNKNIGLLLEIKPPRASAILTLLMRFEKDSYFALNYKQFVLIKVQLNLQKQTNKKWLIYSVEILEVDRQPVNWENI